MHRHNSNELSYYDFVVKKEHKFLTTIFTEKELKSSSNIQTLKTYYEFFEKFIQITTNIVAKNYLTETKFDDDTIMREFLNDANVETYGDLLHLISQHNVKNLDTKKKTKTNEIQTISFMYRQIFNFPGDEDEIKVF